MYELGEAGGDVIGGVLASAAEVTLPADESSLDLVVERVSDSLGSGSDETSH